jgi:predicted HTH transcriptional regulator
LPPEPEPIETTPEPPSSAAPVQTGILHTARDLLNKARVAIQDRKRKKRDKIMQALNTKNKITNDEVEKLLHVSDATATRYLSALEKENKIKQVGKTGKAVEYTRI